MWGYNSYGSKYVCEGTFFIKSFDSSSLSDVSWTIFEQFLKFIGEV